jgi:hypothetical protein
VTVAPDGLPGSHLVAAAERERAFDVTKKKQLPHLVLGGELVELHGHEFRDLSKVDLVGVFPDYASAHQAWKAKAQATVDNAHMRYFIVHLHRLLDPEEQP